MKNNAQEPQFEVGDIVVLSAKARDVLDMFAVFKFPLRVVSVRHFTKAGYVVELDNPDAAYRLVNECWLERLK